MAIGSAESRDDTRSGRDNVLPFRAQPEVGPGLFTATVVARDGFETVQAFHASLATDEAEIVGRLYMLVGATSADAVIVEGFDPDVPLVTALVSPAICDTLTLVAAEPDSPLAAASISISSSASSADRVLRRLTPPRIDRSGAGRG